MILSIETSTSRGSVALGNHEGLIRQVWLDEVGRPSTTLFEALKTLEVTGASIERIVVGLGPGSFSGIRVGLAAAYGLAAAQARPVWGICSAESVARQHRHVTRLGVFADAKRGEYYATVYAHGQLERAPMVVAAAALEAEVSKVTLAVSAEAIVLVPERAYPRAEDYVTVPANSAVWIKQEHLEPIYLREAMK